MASKDSLKNWLPRFKNSFFRLGGLKKAHPFLVLRALAASCHSEVTFIIQLVIINTFNSWWETAAFLFDRHLLMDIYFLHRHLGIG